MRNELGHLLSISVNQPGVILAACSSPREGFLLLQEQKKKHIFEFCWEGSQFCTIIPHQGSKMLWWDEIRREINVQFHRQLVQLSPNHYRKPKILSFIFDLCFTAMVWTWVPIQLCKLHKDRMSEPNLFMSIDFCKSPVDLIMRTICFKSCWSRPLAFSTSGHHVLL